MFNYFYNVRALNPTQRQYSELISVFFTENDNSISVKITPELERLLADIDVLDSDTHLLNDNYKNLSDDMLRQKMIENPKLSSLPYDKREQTRNLVKFLQLTAGQKLYIQTKYRVQSQVGKSQYKAWQAKIKEEPKLIPSSNIHELIYEVRLLEAYSSIGWIL